jgi:NADPH:quinone reductase-like Zn-dependent oxidoreductase
MRSLAICGRALGAAGRVDTVSIEGVAVRCGVLQMSRAEFDPAVPENRRRVQVHVRAFSCNYRDKTLILRMATQGPSDRFYVIGSEFVGHVVAVGEDVSRVSVGDRVIGDNSYPDLRPSGWARGVPTNNASREYLVLREEKVFRVPDSMSDAVAASFSIGAQTAYSMVRKAAPCAGGHVLVTAAGSNTSLFAIGALRSRGAEVYATTTSARHESRLSALGVRRVFRIDPEGPSFADVPEIREVARSLDGFDAVIDPFYDLHLPRVVPVMAFGSRYVTCGLYDQHLQLLPAAAPSAPPDYRYCLELALLKNISLIGNCAGVTDDLADAVRDQTAGVFDVLVDSIHRDDHPGAFLERTYAARDRLGKVVYAY